MANHNLPHWGQCIKCGSNGQQVDLDKYLRCDNCIAKERRELNASIQRDKPKPSRSEDSRRHEKQ